MTTAQFDSLIIVCCHAIWLGGSTAGKDECEWCVSHQTAPTNLGNVEQRLTHEWFQGSVKIELTVFAARLIEDFQSGETPTFVEHIKAGMDELEKRDTAILVFSG
jgi:dihydrofolate synthase